MAELSARDAVEEVSRKVFQDLKTKASASAPQYPDGITAELHELPTFLSKVRWTELGDVIKRAEEPPSRVEGQYWITLRLDGCGFGKFVKRCRRAGLFPERGYAPEFAKLMQDSCQGLANKLGAVMAFTQSDEMTLVIPPAPVVREEQHPHLYNGRVMKLCSFAAAYVTCRFKGDLELLRRAKSLEACEDIDSLEPLFDCRLGVFNSRDAAFSLILWRSYDCGVNGPSDMVHHQRGVLDGAKAVVEKGTHTKLQWLAENGLLPLAPHQAYGTCFVRAKRHKISTDPRNGAEVSTLRSALEQAPARNVINLLLEGQLWPLDSAHEPATLEPDT
eukprot:CAMPEP_0181296060 /NCGR_PEP_ID=MMETSP1101-20121128/4489_1 /TAXON_ID=46948 /ORGANISM="Rhodomonas abbreviata, Strain Caron Lab Isolate" /LENGTH=331 /DNA_ID=CAMNT_0023400873 /DNA_START=176 /DNA_END=1171 /DNA_ORIENTATION=+